MVLARKSSPTPAPGLEAAFLMPAISTPRASMQTLTANWRGATVSVGSTWGVGTPTSSPYLSLFVTPPLTFWLSHSLSVLEALPLQPPQWFKRLRAAQPLAPMLQNSKLTHGKDEKENPLQVRTAANPQPPPCVALGLVAAGPLTPACMLRAILSALCLVYTPGSRCFSS